MKRLGVGDPKVQKGMEEVRGVLVGPKVTGLLRRLLCFPALVSCWKVLVTSSCPPNQANRCVKVSSSQGLGHGCLLLLPTDLGPPSDRRATQSLTIDRWTSEV